MVPHSIMSEAYYTCCTRNASLMSAMLSKMRLLSVLCPLDSYSNPGECSDGLKWP